MRRLTKHLVAPVLILTGFRFSKDYRWGSTLWHRIVYFLIDTVGSNLKADMHIVEEYKKI